MWAPWSLCISFLICPARGVLLVLGESKELLQPPHSYGSTCFYPLPDFFSLCLMSAGRKLLPPTKPGDQHPLGAASQGSTLELMRALQKGSCCS